ncbi:Nucleoporin GLE2 [Teratosphaeria destructans]|uniref:Nucleoporin GLE2 n=1 Tax=Teratosphaeria destructans TaxID=418781 RepID=A0A9W7SJQ2_9PEZI|nr:Nucleoporin GLE2 [Teratosphaeria destructans]
MADPRKVKRLIIPTSRRESQHPSPTQSPVPFSTPSDMAGLFGSAASSASNPTQGDLTKDVALSSPPEDSISDLAFSPQSDHLAVASWDKKVRIYEIDQQGNSQGKALFEHEGPVLNCCWSKDGTKVFGAGADKAARMLDLAAGHTQSSQAQQVAAHDQPIRCVESIQVNGTQMLVTGGWDKMLKYWDLRSPNPAGQVECKERIYTMDTRNDMLVVGTAERWIEVFNINQPTTVYKSIQSPLKWQTRVVSIFSPEPNGYAVGSIEGRCAIQYVEDKDSSNNFSFKCHRQQSPNDRNLSNVYSVNAISFHPQHGTFSTAGSDGTFHFWDKDAKHRLKGYPEVGGTISATDFNRTGSIFAYAVSYDWSKGYQANNAQYPNKIMLHPIIGDECKPRPKTAKR